MKSRDITRVTRVPELSWCYNRNSLLPSQLEGCSSDAPQKSESWPRTVQWNQIEVNADDQQSATCEDHQWILCRGSGIYSKDVTLYVTPYQNSDFISPFTPVSQGPVLIPPLSHFRCKGPVLFLSHSCS